MRLFVKADMVYHGDMKLRPTGSQPRAAPMPLMWLAEVSLVGGLLVLQGCFRANYIIVNELRIRTRPNMERKLYSSDCLTITSSSSVMGLRVVASVNANGLNAEVKHRAQYHSA